VINDLSQHTRLTSGNTACVVELTLGIVTDINRISIGEIEKVNKLPVILTIDPSDTHRALATLTSAFTADPFFRWVFPAPDVYLDGFPRLVTAYCGSGIGAGTAFSDSEFCAACIWLSPGNAPDEAATGAVIEATIPADRIENLFGVLKAMDGYHPHDEPLWYLPFIGVDAPSQGKGLGSALMKHALQSCDEQGTRAYLESSNPANIPLYERHGFEVMGRIEVGTAPPVHPMIREKR